MSHSARPEGRSAPAPGRTRRTFLAWALAGGGFLGWSAAARAASRWWSSLVFGVFENRAFGEVAALPSHRRVAREGTVLSRYYAIGHPSGPNYRAMVSGETWGNGEVVDAFHPSVASIAASLRPPIPTYVYHLAGTAARRHNPLGDLHAPIAAERHGFDTFGRDLDTLPPTCLVYVGWNDANDLHDGDFAQADHNLTALLDLLGRSRWFATPDAAGRYPALFFCYDEDDGTENNRVFAAWWGRGVRRGSVSQVRHTHYGFCRTITDNAGLPPLGKAADEGPIDEVWA
ncbi:MAG TPA: hypothetical protein VKZ50_04810 [bacterium]|nr:hypothetical protein [bacterium]